MRQSCSPLKKGSSSRKVASLHVTGSDNIKVAGDGIRYTNYRKISYTVEVCDNGTIISFIIVCYYFIVRLFKNVLLIGFVLYFHISVFCHSCNLSFSPGIGGGLAWQPGSSFFVFYFQHYFAFANGVNSSCSGLGTLLFPPMVQLLVNYFGWRGAMLCLSAVMANICVCGAVMVPPRPMQTGKHEHRKYEINSENDNNCRVLLQENRYYKQIQKEKEIDYSLTTFNYDNAGSRREQQNTCSYTKLTTRNLTGKSTHVHSTESAENPEDATLTPENHCDCFKVLFKDFDLSLFRQVRFLFNGVLAATLYAISFPVVIYFVPFCVESGISTFKASLLMSIIGICTASTRISPIGWMVDRDVISASKVGGSAAVISGIAIIILPFTKTFSAFVIIACITGAFFLGMAGSLYVYLVKQSAESTEKVPGAIAWMNFFNGVGSVPLILFIGELKMCV